MAVMDRDEIFHAMIKWNSYDPFLQGMSGSRVIDFSN
jgi:hypothetical protein